jgi:hypothetical protein
VIYGSFSVSLAFNYFGDRLVIVFVGSFDVSFLRV